MIVRVGSHEKLLDKLLGAKSPSILLASIYSHIVVRRWRYLLF